MDDVVNVLMVHLGPTCRAQCLLVAMVKLVWDEHGAEMPRGGGS